MTRTLRRAFRTALVAVIALVVVLGVSVSPSQAAQSGSITGYANTQRSAAGAKTLKANDALNNLAMQAAVRSANVGGLSAPASPPSGYTSTQTVMKAVTTTDPAAVYQRALASHGGVMNGNGWTDMGTGFATGGGKTYVILMYASYPSVPEAVVADPAPVQAPKPAPKPKVTAKPAPAPVQAPKVSTPAPAPAPVKASPKPAPKPSATHAPAPKPSQKPSPKPSPKATPKASPSVAKPTPSTTPSTVVETKTVVKEVEVEVPAMDDSTRALIGNGLLGGGVLTGIGASLSAVRWKRLRR